MNQAIRLTDVWKKYHKQEQKTFKELIPALLGGGRAVSSFWALKEVNLQVKKGETIGVVGPNGSGKSTLLKLIAGVSQPTSGEVETNGRIAPLIELGAGFHPELSGRENVYLNGIILGMSREEVDDKFKRIVDFAELWDFIDQPIKHYSSGMYLRLAFAVAVNTDPDILLVDEILAVGDVSFQQKCFERIEKMQSDQVTIVYVSHAMQSIRDICDRAVYIHEGNVVKKGKVDPVIDSYLKNHRE